MKPMFLSNGQACFLNGAIGDKYLVHRVFEINTEYGVEEVMDESVVMVSAVFENQPVEKISEEIKALHGVKDRLQSEVLDITEKLELSKREMENVLRTQISNSKFIINRTDILNAKTLALFPKDRVMPITMDSQNKSFRGLRLTMEARISDGEERYWGYKLVHDNAYTSGDYLCPKYGILIDPTQEQIDETIKKRLEEFEFQDYYIAEVPEKYLSEALKERVAKYRSEKNEKYRAALKKEIETAKAKLRELK